VREVGPVGARIRALFRSRGVRITLGVAAVVGALSPLVPLADVPGYESALVANVLVGLLGGAFGIAAARLERRIERGIADPPGRSPAAPGHPPAPGVAAAPPALAPSPSGLTAALRATAAAAGLALAATLPTFAAALLAGAIGAACSLTAGMPWYAVLPAATAPLAAAVGVVAGAAFERRLPAALLYAAIVGAFTAAAAWPILTGPQVFFFHHLLGYLPGPLYDEALAVRPSLLHFRLVSLAWAAAFLGLAGGLWRDGRLGLPRPRPAAWVLFALGAGGVALGHAARFELGYEQSTESVARALGGRVEGERCVLYHPRELPVDEVRRTLAECDLRVLQIEEYFGVSGSRPQVFLHRSAAEKQRLVGAGGTQFAKPWLGQLHVDPRGFPHGVLKHELAHVVAAQLGRPPFGVTATALGLLPLPVLVEGAAVAADWHPGELTVHEEARALRDLGLAPPLPGLLSPRAFFAESHRRAYTYAGSFVRWLVDTRGREAFARLYRDGDFRAAYGVDVASLVTDFERYLDAVPLSEQARAVALRKFRRPAIFQRPCAREIADLAVEAGDALRAGDPARAAELYGRCSVLDEGEPAHLRSRAVALARAGDVPGIEAIVARLATHPGATDPLRAEVLDALGDARAHHEDWAGAALAYRAAAALLADRDAARSLAVKLEAVADPVLARAVLPYLARGTDARLFAVRDLLDQRPDYATGHYLVGRRLWQRDEPALALPYLDRALSLPLPAPVVREARRVRALCLLALSRYSDASTDLELLAQDGTPGERLEAEDLLSFSRYGASRISSAARP
jgi:tetratricopeptide (TPR) repeat protein